MTTPATTTTVRLAGTTTVRLYLACAVTARADAMEAANSAESDRNWKLFDDAVDKLIDALSMSEEAGVLGQLEQLELLAMSLNADQLAAAVDAPAGERA